MTSWMGLSMVAALCATLASAAHDSLPKGQVSAGDEVVFISKRNGDHNTYLIDLSTEVTRRLTDNDVSDCGLSWSPDETRIAFIFDGHSESGEVYVMDADGSHVNRRPNNDRYEEVPAWSPDGQYPTFGAIASSGDEKPTLQVFVMNMTEHTERQLASLRGHNSVPR